MGLVVHFLAWSRRPAERHNVVDCNVLTCFIFQYNTTNIGGTWNISGVLGSHDGLVRNWKSELRSTLCKLRWTNGCESRLSFFFLRKRDVKGG